METTVIFVVLGSAVLHAVWNAIIKSGPDKLLETMLKACGGGVIALVSLFFVPFPTLGAWKCLGMTMCIHFFYYTFIAYAYRGSDLGYAYTIMRGSAPLLTALGSVFILGEPLASSGWIGIVALSSGVLILAIDAICRGGFSLSVTCLALGNAVIIMGYSLVDGTGVRLAETVASYICWASFLNFFPITIFSLIVRGREKWSAYIKARWHYGLFGGACSLLAYGLALWGMTRAPIAAVAALRETSVVFGMLFGVFFLKETITPARVAAVLLVLAGAMVMRF